MAGSQLGLSSLQSSNLQQTGVSGYTSGGQMPSYGSIPQSSGNFTAPSNLNSSVAIGDGILNVPDEYKFLEKNYLPVSGGAFQNQSQQTPSGQQFGSYNVPPPPVKRMRLDGTNAVRSVFGPYAQPGNGYSQNHLGQQQVNLPSLNQQQSSFQPKSLFSWPPPPLNQTSGHGPPAAQTSAPGPPPRGPGAPAPSVHQQYHQA